MSRLRILTAAFLFVGLSCLATPAAAKIFLIHGASGKEYGIYEVDSVAGEVTWLGARFSRLSFGSLIAAFLAFLLLVFGKNF